MARRAWAARLTGADLAEGIRGRGLSAPEAVPEEVRSLQAPAALAGFGLTMIGPLLLHEGSEEQKREHLPRSSAARSLVPGNSEPGAGSTSPACRRAVADGRLLHHQRTENLDLLRGCADSCSSFVPIRMPRSTPASAFVLMT